MKGSLGIDCILGLRGEHSLRPRGGEGVCSGRPEAPTGAQPAAAQGLGAPFLRCLPPGLPSLMGRLRSEGGYVVGLQRL